MTDILVDGGFVGAFSENDGVGSPMCPRTPLVKPRSYSKASVTTASDLSEIEEPAFVVRLPKLAELSEAPSGKMKKSLLEFLSMKQQQIYRKKSL